MQELEYIDINSPDGESLSAETDAEASVSTDAETTAGTGAETDVSPVIPAAAPTPPSPSVARLVYSAYSGMQPPPDSKYAPLGLGRCMLILFFTSIPAVGLLGAMVIALSSKKVAVHRLALSVVLLRTVFWVAAAIAAAVAVYAFHIDVFGWIYQRFLVWDAA